MNSAEMLVFAPTFALTAVVVVGWTLNEVVRLRTRGWRVQARFATSSGAPRQLTQPSEPMHPVQAASNDELGQRQAA